MIIFKNKGLIDLDAVTTMAVSAKENENPIGQFGTGLKYAIAIVLRNGGSVTMYRGKKSYKFGRIEKTIRDKPFNIITMNDRQLGYTDQLGLHWEMWMAYREFWSNVRDEGGVAYSLQETLNTDPENDATTFFVNHPEFEKVHATRHTIILQTFPEQVIGQQMDIRDGKSEFVFYRGIRAMKLAKPSKYTYNILEPIQLTEDRTVMYTWSVPSWITRAIIKSNYKPFLYDVLSITSGEIYESTLPYKENKNYPPSPSFMEVADDLRNQKKLNPAASSLFDHYKDTMPGYVSPYIVTLNATEQALVDDALARLKELDGEGLTGFDIQFKSKMETGFYSVGKHTVTIGHSAIEKGRHFLLHRLLEALAWTKGGSATEQLCHFVFNGTWIPKELTNTPSAASVEEKDEMPF